MFGKSTAILCGSMLLVSAAFADGPSSMQSRESYEAAIKNNTTSPSYVLISVVDGKTGRARTVCTTANFLLGALHREYGLGYGIADSSKAIEIALGNPEHAFRFEQQAALDNIPSGSSEEDLSAARKLLAPFSSDELKARFSAPSPAYSLPSDGYKKDAIACALIQRGLSPKMADRSGQIYVGR